MSLVKHCTTDWKKRRREHCSKIELVLTQKEEGKKKQPKKNRSWREGRKSVLYMYVLRSMFATFPTSHAERSPLKAPADSNTAPHTATKKKVQR
jgi:hypothetical protein